MCLTNMIARMNSDQSTKKEYKPKVQEERHLVFILKFAIYNHTSKAIQLGWHFISANFS